jgi:hypothetical protein
MNEDLILVAEFMGGASYPEFTSSIYPAPEPTIVYDLPPTDSASKLWAVTELRYDTDRDWLNPVLDKIFIRVVKFIKWYNNETHNN